MNKKIIKKGINTLVKRADQYQCIVRFVSGDDIKQSILLFTSIIVGKKDKNLLVLSTILINNRLSDLHKLYCLCHEMGHMFLYYGKYAQFSGGILAKVVFDDDSNFIREREVQAWNIADKLLLNVDKKLYDSKYVKYKQEALATYYKG